MHVTSRNEETVLALNQQIRCRTYAVREEQRQAGRSSLVDGDTPRLVVRKEGEDVGIDVGLCKFALSDVTKNCQAHSEPRRTLDQRLATRTSAGNHEAQSRVAGLGHGADEIVNSFLRHEPRDR